ncbi:MAG: fatty acid/phospholipid biosynthesis enzyme [Cellvibrionaceae bacterium]|jgi:fatty acid/phospholipid biosynthesis enzyme
MAIKPWQGQCDLTRCNGAKLLGVKSLVVKSHSGVSGHAFSQASSMLIEKMPNYSSAFFDDLLRLFDSTV